MATTKRVFTLRLTDDVFDKIGTLAANEHRSMTNYIEYVLIKHLEQVEQERGVIDTKKSSRRGEKQCRYLKQSVPQARRSLSIRQTNFMWKR